MNYIIWNKTDKLKDLEPKVWFNSYPQSKTKTLILIDDVYVIFAEDERKNLQLDENSTDDDVAKAYIKKLEEENKRAEEEEKNRIEGEKNLVEKVNQLEKDKINLSLANVQVLEQMEKEKQDLALANVELMEQVQTYKVELENKIKELEKLIKNNG